MTVISPVVSLQPVEKEASEKKLKFSFYPSEHCCGGSFNSEHKKKSRSRLTFAFAMFFFSFAPLFSLSVFE